ncbi:MAG: hypothetical protein U0995_01525, partial [Erythrobacter sp.]|nr:hypothetical protein [Erythrobacter sp.]
LIFAEIAQNCASANNRGALRRCNTCARIYHDSESLLAFGNARIKESAGQGRVFHQTVTEQSLCRKRSGLSLPALP